MVGGNEKTGEGEEFPPKIDCVLHERRLNERPKESRKGRGILRKKCAGGMPRSTSNARPSKNMEKERVQLSPENDHLGTSAEGLKSQGNGKKKVRGYKGALSLSECQGASLCTG